TSDRKEKVLRAAQIQHDLLTDRTPDLEGYELSGLCRPTEEMAGDFFDWHQPEPGTLVLTLGDVMGKGMSAAILMATLRMALRSSDWLPTVNQTVVSVAESTFGDLEKSGSFMTLFHARLDVRTGVLTYVDAGHGLLVVVAGDGRVTRPARGGSPPLGVLPAQGYPEQTVELRPGDALVVFSDGVL